MYLLSPHPDPSVTLSLWIFKKGKDPQPFQANFILNSGHWQIVEVEADITRSNLKKVLAELYYYPAGAEFIIQTAFFGKK